MKHTANDSKPRRRRITFELHAPEAKEAYLVGEFTGWDRTALPMKKNGNGVWVKQVLLPPGQFEYKFFVDSRWMADPRNDRTCPNGFGSANSIVNVLA